MARSVWLSKKGLLYLSSIVLLLGGGAVILSAPYHYIGFISGEGDIQPFEIWDRPGYYEQLEISVSVRAGNSTVISVDFRIVENNTDATYVVNMTLDPLDTVPGSNPPVYVDREVIDIPFGNYTIFIDRVVGPGSMDIGYTQLSDSRLFIVTGGTMNIIGLIAGFTAWCISGSVLSDEEKIVVDWGYDEKSKRYSEE
ncbi:hypothetical protein EU538_02545 [Candidatus Thorarchaeota archaeon]|nr:MAG: hypothetical protein EU538_02545 [Candidatus Thorarchaeota archaeon]